MLKLRSMQTLRVLESQKQQPRRTPTLSPEKVCCKFGARGHLRLQHVCRSDPVQRRDFENRPEIWHRKISQCAGSKKSRIRIAGTMALSHCAPAHHAVKSPNSRRPWEAVSLPRPQPWYSRVPLGHRTAGTHVQLEAFPTGLESHTNPWQFCTICVSLVVWKFESCLYWFSQGMTPSSACPERLKCPRMLYWHWCIWSKVHQNAKLARLPLGQTNSVLNFSATSSPSASGMPNYAVGMSQSSLANFACSHISSWDAKSTKLESRSLSKANTVCHPQKKTQVNFFQ